MKVIYIDGSTHNEPCMERLIEGNVYEVVGTIEHNGKSYYQIKGHEKTSNGNSCYYHTSHFVPLSEIDETEMERSYGKQHA